MRDFAIDSSPIDFQNCQDLYNYPQQIVEALTQTRRRLIFSVGYALLQKKQRSFVQSCLIRIDTDKLLMDQGPFDCVLHKLNDEDWRKQLKEYSVRNPSAYIIDSRDAIQRLHNRISMLEVILEIEAVEVKDGESASFGTPKQTVIYEPEKRKDPTSWGEGLKFPVIAKPFCSQRLINGNR